MPYDASLERYQDLDALWDLSDEHISGILGSLSSEGQEIASSILIYGLWRRHPVAEAWLRGGGRKIGILSLQHVLTQGDRRGRLNEVLRAVLLGECSADRTS